MSIVFKFSLEGIGNFAINNVFFIYKKKKNELLLLKKKAYLHYYPQLHGMTLLFLLDGLKMCVHFG